MLQLVPGPRDGRGFVVRVLQFEDDERQTVDINDEIRAAVVVATNGELTD